MERQIFKSIALACAAGVFSCGVSAQAASESQSALDRAIAAYEEGRLGEAEQSLQELLNKYPRSVAVLNNLAVVALERGRLDEAVDLLRRALASNRAVMTTYLNLTAVYERKAAEAYRRALSIGDEAVAELSLNMVATLDEVREGGAVAQTPDERRGEDVVREIIESDEVDEPFVDDPARGEAPVAKASDKAAQSSAPKSPAPKSSASKSSEEAKEPEPAVASPYRSSGGSSEGASGKAAQATKKPPQSPQSTEEALVEWSPEQEDAIIEAVNRWADAWSNRDLTEYYQSYTRKHSPRRMSHEEWREFRAVRLSAPKSIDVSLVDFEVRSASEDKAQVEFVQKYRSDLLSSDAVKRLYLVREDDDWKITREIVIKRLK